MKSKKTLADLEKAERDAFDDFAYNATDSDDLLQYAGDIRDENMDVVENAAVELRDFGRYLHDSAELWLQAREALEKARAKK